MDQFSFLESEDGHLNVVVRGGAHGDGMWRAEWTRADLSLLRVPLSAFGDGSDEVPHWLYRPLPPPSGHVFRKRFVGDHLLYGSGSGWGRPRTEELGTLASRQDSQGDDGCKASCVDWYGNARPLFIRGRVFALLGYELVEGVVDRDRLRELTRVSFAPAGSGGREVRSEGR